MKHNLSVRLVNVEGRGADITEKPDDCTNTARGIAVRQTKAEQNVFFFWVMRHDERSLEQNLLNETKKLRLETNGAGTDEISTGLKEKR